MPRRRGNHQTARENIGAAMSAKEAVIEWPCPHA